MDVELLYNSVPQEIQGVFSLETRCGWESQHPTEGASEPPIEEFGDQRDGEMML